MGKEELITPERVENKIITKLVLKHKGSWFPVESISQTFNIEREETLLLATKLVSEMRLISKEDKTGKILLKVNDNKKAHLALLEREIFFLKERLLALEEQRDFVQSNLNHKKEKSKGKR
jgi:hypothetical protein